MSLVKGKIISSETISLSSASSILEDFLSSHNGITGEVLAFLKRSSVAIDELLIATKEGKSHQNHRHHGPLNGNTETHESHLVEGGKQPSVLRKASNEVVKQESIEFEELHKMEERKGRDTEAGDGGKHRKRKKASDNALSNASDKTGSQDEADEPNGIFETEARKKRKKHHQVHEDVALNLASNDAEGKLSKGKHQKTKKERDTHDQFQQDLKNPNVTAVNQGIEGEKKHKKHRSIHQGLAQNSSPNRLEKSPCENPKKKRVKIEDGFEQDTGSIGTERKSKDKHKKHK